MSAKIALALHQVMQACGYVQKTGKNTFHGYKYAGEADLLEKLRPAMIEAGLILIPSVCGSSAIDEHGNVTVNVEYTLVHKDGDIWPEKVMAIGCGNDRAKNGSVGDKGIYKALTGANKYLLFKLFQIETGDDPEASDAPPPQKKKPNVADNVEEYEAPGEPPPAGEVHPQTRYEPHVREGLSQVPRKTKPAGWDDAVAIINGAKDYAELQIALKKPHYVNTTSAWSNYWLLKLANDVFLPKVAEFRGTDAAIEMGNVIKAKYPLERVQEAAE